MSYKQLEMLEKIEKHFSQEDSFALKELSNRATQSAVWGFDKGTAKIAVFAYALSKIVSKEHVVKNPLWGKAKRKIFFSLDECIKLLRKNKQEEFLHQLDKVEHSVTEVDHDLGNYVRNIWDKAKIKIASNAYAQGMSLSKATDLTNANKAELQNYIGITKIHDEEKTGITMKQRMKIARTVFE